MAGVCCVSFTGCCCCRASGVACLPPRGPSLFSVWPRYRSTVCFLTPLPRSCKTRRALGDCPHTRSPLV